MQIRRILLAVDPSEDGGSAVRTAIDLGVVLNAEIEALFVEDIDLLRTAGLPFTRELQSFSAAPRAVRVGTMEQGLRREAQRMRHLLAQHADTANIAWSFSVARGAAVTELLGRSAGYDLLVVSRLGAAVAATDTLEPLLQSLIAASRCAVLIARGALDPLQPVVAIYEGGERGAKLLDLTLRLAEHNRQAAVVVLPVQHRASLEPEVLERFAAAGTPVALRAVDIENPAVIQRLMRVPGGRLWLLAARDRPDPISQLIGMRRPLLLVR